MPNTPEDKPSKVRKGDPLKPLKFPDEKKIKVKAAEIARANDFAYKEAKQARKLVGGGHLSSVPVRDEENCWACGTRDFDNHILSARLSRPDAVVDIKDFNGWVVTERGDTYVVSQYNNGQQVGAVCFHNTMYDTFTGIVSGAVTKFREMESEPVPEFKVEPQPV